MTNPKFIYFDVGGVAIKDFSDSNKWVDMLHEMGAKDDDFPQIDEIYDAFEDEVCKGYRSIDDLVLVLKSKFNLTIDDNFSMLEYFVNHFESNQTIWPIIDKLKNKSKVGLLTDMYPGMLDLIKSKKLLPNTTWDAVVDSSLIGLRKPMPEIYDYASKQANVSLNEILFIDNRQKNIDAAIKFGWQAYLYDSKDYDKSSQKLAQLLEL